MTRTKLTYKKNGHIDWVAMDAAGVHPSVIFAEAVYHGDNALAAKASKAGVRIELRELRKAGGAA